jgi:hypothetical protein
MDITGLFSFAFRRLYLHFCVNVDSDGTQYFFYLPLYHNSDINITLTLMGFNVNFVLSSFIIRLRGREIWTIKNRKQENASGGRGAKSEIVKVCSLSNKKR